MNEQKEAECLNKSIEAELIGFNLARSMVTLTKDDKCYITVNATSKKSGLEIQMGKTLESWINI